MRSAFTTALLVSITAAAQNTKTSTADVAAAAATALTRTVTSNVKNKMFGHIAIVWLESTDDAVASQDRDHNLEHGSFSPLIRNS